MENDQWKKDRERLRKIVREGGGITTVYALIAHMRGKLHMHSCFKYSGGWRRSKRQSPRTAQPDESYRKAYGDSVNYYFDCCVVEDLEDQADYIRTYVTSDELKEVAARVLAGYPEEELLQQAG
jgi:hypothetical protein